MELLELQHIIQAVIQGSTKPVTFDELMLLFEENKDITDKEVKSVIKKLLAKKDSVQELKKIAGGYRYQIKAKYSPWLQKTQGKDNEAEKSSKVLNETLAIIAYKQPITRGEIDLIRGASTHLSIFQELEERGWVKIVAYGGTSKRAALYGTTSEFLEHFNLNSIYDLPELEVHNGINCFR